MVHGSVREVVRGPGPLDWSTDRGSVFSGHPVFRQSLPYKWNCVRYCATSFPGLFTDLRVIKDV